jgi:Fe-Mn family superoxide dismutase
MIKRTVIALSVTACLMGAAVRAQETGKTGGPLLQTLRAYKAAEYPGLYKLPGFSSQLIASHIKLYQGYVNNTNAMAEKLAALLADGKEKTPEYAELKRRFGWEFDGMRLHELYFGNMAGPVPPKKNDLIYKRIQENFGSFDAWRTDFTGTGLMRGIGWVVLYQDTQSGRLFNAWINEHDGGHLAGCTPLLVMDVFEHAYITDYGLERAKYIEAFLSVVNWETVEERFSK